VISTHNGKANPFAGLIKEVREGIRPGRVHTYPFDLAVAQGLYERAWATRLRYKGYDLSPADKARWYDEARRSYGSRTEAMREELDAVPREGDGTMLPLALIEAAHEHGMSHGALEDPPARRAAARTPCATARSRTYGNCCGNWNA